MNIKFKNITKLLAMMVPIYLLTLGMAWVFIHLYFRFIIERSPYYFQEIKYNITVYHIFIFILFTIFHLVLIFLSILEIRKKRNKN